MDQTNTRTAWIVGIIIVAILLVLFAWLWSSNRAARSTTGTTAGEIATSTTPAVIVGNTSTSSVAAVVAGLPDTSIFNVYLSRSGLLSQLNGKGPYTIFVPTNEAFGFLPPGTIDRMTTSQLKRLVQFHVVPKALDIDAISSGSVQTLAGSPLNFQVNLQNNIVSINSAYALQEYRAKNGIIYLVTAVLFPPNK